MINTVFNGLTLFKGNSAEVSDLAAGQTELLNSVSPHGIQNIDFSLFIDDP
jgi:hypothetical protein